MVKDANGGKDFSEELFGRTLAAAKKRAGKILFICCAGGDNTTRRHLLDAPVGLRVFYVTPTSAERINKILLAKVL